MSTKTTNISDYIQHLFGLEDRPDKLDLLRVHAELCVWQAAELVHEDPGEQVVILAEVLCRVRERFRRVGQRPGRHNATETLRSGCSFIDPCSATCDRPWSVVTVATVLPASSDEKKG